MKWWQKFIIGLILLLSAIVIGFVIWGETPAKAMPEAVAAMYSDGSVQITSGKWLIFQPAEGKVTTGLIFYPGGRVDYRAYAPMAHALASQGYLVVIPRMPLNLAVFGFDKAEEVIQTFPEVKKWVIGGHSLGGSMAAHYLFQHPDEFSGLIFLASYPASSDDLTGYAGRVLSLSGALDGLATPEKIAASHSLLPDSTKFVEIPGGNHAYFGWYGDQSGDNPAGISRESQQTIVVENILELLSTIKMEN